MSSLAVYKFTGSQVVSDNSCQRTREHWNYVTQNSQHSTQNIGLRI